MKFVDAIRGLGRPRNIVEAVDAIRATEGKSGSRELANRLGVSLRQAQRYLAGKVKRPPAEKERAVLDMADRKAVAANALRGARTVSVGRVKVTDSKGHESSRPVGTLAVDADMRRDLNEVADLIRGGRDREAEDKMSQAVMAGYSRSKSDNRTIAPGALSVSDYPDGIDVG